MSEVCIIGGGASGMFAALLCARKGSKVTLYEKNEKLGKKLYITGKGRCNLTNHCTDDAFFDAVVSNPRFLYSAYAGCTNQDVMNLFEELGVPLKTERGNRVFPESDRSSDIIRSLQNELMQLKVRYKLHTEVKKILLKQEKAASVLLADGTVQHFDRIIVATGGMSYPVTGSTGDGYKMAEELGHKIIPLTPALVPLLTREAYVRSLQGLALKNVTFSVQDGKRTIFSEFGELLFTHKGISGPVVLSASSHIGRKLQKQDLEAQIDLKPALSEEQLDARLLREFETARNKTFRNAVHSLLPASLLPVAVTLSGILEMTKVHDITKSQRADFIRILKHFPLTLCGMGSFKEAIITQGGIDTRLIHPKTMESKKIKNLYFSGEVLDLDAVTGGFNLQIAWSTAHAAACAVTEDQ
ncbi:MAG: NAD(P)/FAD-dependent oxidoreductase [Lachnospiraceae bacterium]